MGYLAVSLVDINWIDIEPVFSTATPENNSEFLISIDPSGLTGGMHAAGFTVYSSHANQMESKYISVSLDYTTDVSDGESGLPNKFALYQNFPNPFNPSTRIKYDLKQETNIKLKIFNILGQKVRSLVNDVQPAGRYNVTWDGTDDSGKLVSSGIYLYRIFADDFISTKKLILLK